MTGGQLAMRLIVLAAAVARCGLGHGDEAGFVPLFDGKSLAGWQGDLAGYEIVNGELHSKPKVCRNLMTKVEYGDFVFRLEFRLQPGGNSGIGVRAGGLSGIAYDGMEIQVLDDRHSRYESIEPWQAHGSIYGVVAAERDALKPAGEWNTQEVTVKGTHVTVVVNGRKVVDVDTAAFRDGRPTPDGRHHPGLARTKGLVGLLGHGEEVHFRNIRIKPLEAAAADPPLVLAPETTIIVRAPAPAPVPAAAGGKPRPVPDNAGVAARLLQEYLRKCHGVAAGFEIVAEEKFAADAVNGKQILAVGPTKWVEPDSLAGTGQDGFVIARHGDVVTICGGRGDVAAIQGRGTIHGAADFLNRFAGVRFYMPGDLWTSLPIGRPVAVPAGFTLRSEPFVRHGSMTGMVGTAAGDWLVRNAANTRAGLAGTHFHNMWNVFPPEKYAATHPDIYPLVNGERYIPKDAKDQGWNPCFTNPRTIEVAEASAREFFAANPDMEWFSMGLQDGHKSCECPGCVAEFAAYEQEFVAAMKAGNPERIVRTYNALVDPARDEKTLAKAIELERRGPRSYAISQIQWRLLDALGERLEKTLPGKYVEALAYGISSFAPRRPLRPNAMLYAQIHLSDNVRGLMIPRPDGTLPVDAFVDASAAFGEHDWYQGSGFAAPRIYTDFWAKFLRHVKTKRKKMFVVHAEAYPNWGLDGPKLWVVSRLWWDPDQESDPLWRQFTADMFGPAQEPMRRYFATLEKWFQEQSVEPDWGGPPSAVKWNIQGYKPVFQRKPEDLARMREARACLDEAARLVKTDDEKKRLDLFSRSFRLTEYLFELATLGGDDAKVEEVKRYVRQSIIPEPMTLHDGMRTEAELDRIITLVRKPAAAAPVPAAAPAKPAAAAAIDIGTRRELFVDRFLIDRLEGTRLKLHEPRLAPAVTPPRPNGHYGTVLFKGDRYQFYYRGDKDPKITWQRHGIEALHDGEVTLYAESPDGIHWTLPDLKLFAHPSFPAGNIVLMNEFMVNHNFAPFIDTRPGVPADETYKALGGLAYQAHKAQQDVRAKRGPGGLKAFTSPDGIHWKKVRDEAVIPEEWGKYFDSQNVAFWSEPEQCYVCYFRIFDPGRSIARTTSKDFLTWTPPVPMKPNAPGEELYTSCTQPYARAPHIAIALPTRFVAKRGAATDIAFMTTRGGERYDRTFMESFIRPGLGQAGWGNRKNYAAVGIHPTSETEMSLFLTEGRRYTLRLDGFASVNAPFAGGEMITKPLTFSGKRLEINYSTSAGGQMRVELQDASGQPLPGFALADCEPIFGDEIARTVKWKGGDLGALADRPIRLRFAMEDADLFALRFCD